MYSVCFYSGSWSKSLKATFLYGNPGGATDRGSGVHIPFLQDARFLATEVPRVPGGHHSVLRPPFPCPATHLAPGLQPYSQPSNAGPGSRSLPSPALACFVFALPTCPHLPGDLLSKPSGCADPLSPVFIHSHTYILCLSHFSSPGT